MARVAGKAQCMICDTEKNAVKCECCSKMFCHIHLSLHREELSQQLDEIEQNFDLFGETLTRKKNHPQQHSLIKQIDQWEKDSINKIQQKAEECRQLVFHHLTKHFTQIEDNFVELTN
ncbi:unnamed protein product [Rotaria sordida]|uniref:B box-type domain-containing protein n=1 Tax=Rotaria sordida TaxID=392033 RepID=A0A814SIC8_9BILA|nr:unnamed protein product [Rotaria sordida]CAF1384955.1 unnamed protein product [Rotaria sordida]